MLSPNEGDDENNYNYCRAAREEECYDNNVRSGTTLTAGITSNLNKEDIMLTIMQDIYTRTQVRVVLRSWYEAANYCL